MKIKLDAGAYMPRREHGTDAGIDLMTPVTFTIAAHSNYAVDTKVHVQLPRGTVGMIKSKSGLNVKHNILTEGVVDEGYTGTVCVKLYNHGDRPKTFMRGDKIAQLCVIPVLYVDLELTYDMDETERGNNGFGSTGR